MADEFDTARAAREHRSILERVQAARNVLTTDVINYYWERQPRSDDDVRKYQSDMRRYLNDVRDRIDAVLRDL